jgi:uncharacterized protein
MSMISAGPDRRVLRPVAALWRAVLLLSLSALAGFAPGLLLAQVQAPVPALTSPVVDTTGTLSASEIAQLEQQALALQQRKGSQLQILIVSTTQPEDIAAYAQRVFDQSKLGRKGVDDGVLLLIAKDDRRARIQTGYGLEGAIPDITANRVIQEYLVPKLRAGDFAGGIVDASAALVKVIDGEVLPEPMADADSASNKALIWPIGAFVALWFALIARAVLDGIPRLLRIPALAAIAAGIAWLVTGSGSLLAAIVAGIIGAVLGMIGMKVGRLARSGNWHRYAGSGMRSGGTSSGGWSGGSSGGGWSGGGGRSGGGGASGSW